MPRDPLHSYPIDRRLAAILGASIALHLGIAIWAWTGDVELDVSEPPPGAHLAFRQESVELVLPDLVAPAVAAPVTAPSPLPVTAPAPRVAAAAVRLDPRVEAVRLATLVGDPLGPDETRAPGIHLADPRTVEIGRTDRGPRPGPALRLGPPAPTLVTLDGPELVPAPKRDARPLRIEPAPNAPPVRTTLVPADVIARINAAYLPGLQRCYRRALSADPSLTGKVALAFAVDAAGHVSDAEATGGSTELAACVEQQMAGWRFGLPRDGKGQPAEASFRVSLALQSS